MGREHLGALAVRIQESRHPIVLIDGGSGAGKSDLATELAPLLGAELVRLEDVYRGWDGLEAASEAVASDILGAGRWQRWDWIAGAPAEWHEIDTERPLIVEGCGALSHTNRALATFGIWIELDEPTRKARALARDGDTYAPHWDRWAAQEQEFFERERPDLLADTILAG
ncbi:MAG TPA: ATP-binding protein [Galbitalea sp.]